MTREFKGKATWTASEWGEVEADGVEVHSPAGKVYVITHEDHIDRLIPAAPDDLKAYARREILAHRTTAENEFRVEGESCVWQFRMHGGRLEYRASGDARWASRDSWEPTDWAYHLNQVLAAARAWCDRQWQDVAGEDGWQVRKAEQDCVEFRNESIVSNDHWHFVRRWADEAEVCVTVTKLRDTLVPEPVIRACCKLLGVEREEPLRDSEGTHYGRRVEFEIPNDGRDGVIVDGSYNSRATCEALARTANSDPQTNWAERALAYLNKRRPKLAENQIRANTTGPVFSLRWHDGGPQISNGDAWCHWMMGFGGTFNEAGDAWFRANCPPDRFVTDDGRVLEFRMRDDGEAEVAGDRGLRTDDIHIVDEEPRFRSCYDALCRFCDAERAKWTIKRVGAGVRMEGPGVDLFTSSGIFPEFIPTWVRRKAEAMLAADPTIPEGGREFVEDGRKVLEYVDCDGDRLKARATTPGWYSLKWGGGWLGPWDRETPYSAPALPWLEKQWSAMAAWRVEWSANVGGFVKIYRPGNSSLQWANYEGSPLDGHALTGSPDGPIPEATLREAEALYREKHVLKADECWVGGLLAKMTLRTDRVDLERFASWMPQHTRAGWCDAYCVWQSDAERLEAYDRCKTFWESRPLAVDEFFDSKRRRNQMRVRNDVFEWRGPETRGSWMAVGMTLESMAKTFPRSDSWPRALAFRDRELKAKEPFTFETSGELLSTTVVTLPACIASWDRVKVTIEPAEVKS